ncbi:MAG: cell surface protein [Phycisphaerae bacterium]|jgi:hypothetical protein|nr:cell surface protein [Phycisphaerae bacterium]
MGDFVTGRLPRTGAGLLLLTAVAAVAHLAIARTAEPKSGPGGGQAAKYLSPTAMVADKAGKTIYIAQATAGRVAVFDVAARKVTATIAIGPPVSGVAISPNGTTLYVTAGGAQGKLCVIDIKSRKITARIPVGHTPISPVVSPDGKTAYVCNRFNNAIGVVGLAAGKQIKTINVPRQPVSADLSKDGSVLIVANHFPAGPASAKHIAAEVTILDTASRRDPVTLKLPNGSTSLRAVRVSPDGKYAAVTHTLARFRLPTTSLERHWMNTNALSIVDVPGRKLVNTIVTDDVDKGAPNSWALAWSSDSKRLCVTHAGSHEISVIDMTALLAKFGKALAKEQDQNVRNDLSFLVGLRRRIKLTGKGPRCITLIGTKAFVGEYFTDSLSVADIAPAKAKPKIESIALGPKTAMTEVRRGEMLFNDASISFQQWQGCATCHPDGRSDGLNWDLFNDGMGNPKNTKSLLWAHKTPPSMITGIRTDAKETVRKKIRFALFSVQPEKNALAILAYLKSLKPAPSPFLVNSKPSLAAQRGKLLFNNKAQCNSCHSGEFFTDQKKHNVSGKAFDTPTLIEVWRTAPYLYKGQAATILDVLSRKHNPKHQHGKTSKLTQKERGDLAQYVLSL